MVTSFDPSWSPEDFAQWGRELVESGRIHGGLVDGRPLLNIEMAAVIRWSFASGEHAAKLWCHLFESWINGGARYDDCEDEGWKQEPIHIPGQFADGRFE